MTLKKTLALVVMGLSLVFSSLPSVAEVNVSEAWVRLLPPMSKMTAAYMNLKSDQDDRLISVSSDIAKTIQIHQSKAENGVMSMQQVTNLALPKGVLVELKPQSYHLMVMGLVKPLHKTESYLFTLEFEKAGKLDIQVPVRNP